MQNNTFYNELLTDHNLHPAHKKKLEDANLVLEGVNPSCGDDIILELKEENGVIVDGAFVGSARRVAAADAPVPLGPAAQQVLVGEDAITQGAHALLAR